MCPLTTPPPHLGTVKPHLGTRPAGMQPTPRTQARKAARTSPLPPVAIYPVGGLPDRLHCALMRGSWARWPRRQALLRLLLITCVHEIHCASSEFENSTAQAPVPPEEVTQEARVEAARLAAEAYSAFLRYRQERDTHEPAAQQEASATAAAAETERAAQVEARLRVEALARAATEAELASLRAEAEAVARAREEAAELSNATAELGNTTAELGNTTAELGHSTAELSNAAAELSNATAEPEAEGNATATEPEAEEPAQPAPSEEPAPPAPPPALARLLAACRGVANAASARTRALYHQPVLAATALRLRVALTGAVSRARGLLGCAHDGLGCRVVQGCWDAPRRVVLACRAGLAHAARSCRDGLAHAVRRGRSGLGHWMRRRRDGVVQAVRQRRVELRAAYRQFWLRDRAVSRVLRHSRAGEWYRVLQVGRRASKPQLKGAYRRLAKRCHPDKTRDDRANMAFDQLRDAFDLLSNQVQRGTYDEKLAREDRLAREKRQRQRQRVAQQARRIAQHVVRAALGALARIGRAALAALARLGRLVLAQIRGRYIVP